jgi:hypothetical protein
MADPETDHFVAYSYNGPTRSWSKYDDSKVEQVNAQHIDDARRHAFVMVYVNFKQTTEPTNNK